MLYLIQKNTFRTENFNALVDAMNKLEYEYQIVHTRPRTSSLFIKDDNENNTYFQTEREDIFAFGANKMADNADSYDWKPGSMMNREHDYSIYKDYYTDNLLNWDSDIVKFTDKLDFVGEKFIRPCEDSKIFTGQVFTLDRWNEFVKSVNHYESRSRIRRWTEIQVASVKTIYREVRCWIIDGKVITSARYKGMDLGPHEYDAEKFAQEMVDTHSTIAEAFVMDVCLTSDGWKIVELNCINCSGFYGADVSMILFELNEHFNK